MNIAYLCADFGVPVRGTKGASIHVRELSQALRDLGHEVLIISPRAGGRGDEPTDFEVPIHELRPDWLDQQACDLLTADPAGGQAVAREVRALLYATSLRQRALPLLHAFRPDVIYERYALLATGGLGLARELGVPLMLEVNAPLSDEQVRHRGLAFEELARGLERTQLCSADRVVTVSRELERWLIDLGVEPDRITVLPNGVDVERFRVAAGERKALRARLGLANRPVVGFLGTLKPWHDTRGLIQALSILRREGLAAHLLVVGDGPERQLLEALARDEGLETASTFVGAVPHEQVPAYLAAMDLAVAPYGPGQDFYFSPLKLFEYFAAGRPVVAANLGQLADCVRPGETGLLYEAGEASALAAAIRTLLDDPALAARLGQAGLAHVRERHTWQGNARTIVELARPLLGAVRRAS